MNRTIFMGALLAFGMAVPAAAHAPLMDCYDNGDGTITCEAGYSDGGSAANQIIRVRDADHRLVFEDRFGDDSAFTFDRPDAAEFQVQFEGDQFHSLIFYSLDIEWANP